MYGLASPSGSLLTQVSVGGRANAFPDWAFTKFMSGQIRGYAQFSVAFGAGESLTLNVTTAAAVTILTAPLVLAAQAFNTRVLIPFSQALWDAVAADTLLIIDAAYVAGGAPTNPAVAVFVQVGNVGIDFFA